MEYDQEIDTINRRLELLSYDLKKELRLSENIFAFKYCQSEIEDKGKCKIQCNHCKEYYKSLENE